jgi:hypothetical protein
MVLIIGERNYSDLDGLWELYQSFYRAVLPKEKFEKSVKRQ